jgi:uncharacterized membrane protein
MQMFRDKPAVFGKAAELISKLITASADIKVSFLIKVIDGVVVESALCSAPVLLLLTSNQSHHMRTLSCFHVMILE